MAHSQHGDGLRIVNFEQRRASRRPKGNDQLAQKRVVRRGTDTGAQAISTVEQLMAQAQTALREGRATSVRAGQAMMDGYAALVSGVLIGISEGLQAGAASTPSEGHSRKK